MHAPGCPNPSVETIKTLLVKAASFSGLRFLNSTSVDELAKDAHTLITKSRASHGAAAEEIFWIQLGLISFYISCMSNPHAHNVFFAGCHRPDVLGMILLFRKQGIFSKDELDDMGYNEAILERAKGTMRVFSLLTNRLILLLQHTCTLLIRQLQKVGGTVRCA